MTPISDEARLFLWLITGIAATLVALLSIYLDSNIRYGFRQKFSTTSGGQRPPRRSFFIWFVFGISILGSILGAAWASSAPSIPEITPTILTPITTIIPSPLPTLSPTQSETPMITETPTISSTPVIVGGMVEVPAGNFIRGSTPDQITLFNSVCSPNCNFQDEGPQDVIFLNDYWIDVYEVTNNEFKAFTKATGTLTDAEKNNGSYVLTMFKYDFKMQYIKGANWKNPYGPNSSIDGLSNYPVVHVSWNDAKAYCKWMGKRLPTEAEWEKAARGPKGRIYPWGDNPDISRYNALENNSSNPSLLPVGSFPNGVSYYGVQDMMGNVTELIIDFYYNKYYAISPLINPRNDENLSSQIVQRGGSYLTTNPYIRTTWRDSSLPSSSFNTVGFRCARDS